jgi:D-glycero-alpha-D-manno-heptose-7-phosphate kinase
MIISRTPFRISFFGGGTDYPVWYNEHGGAVLATSINRYCHLFCRYLPPFFDKKFRVVYSIIEFTKTIEEIQHPAVRECLRYLDIRDGMAIHHDGDLPARTGLGSSSSFTVGMLHSLHALRGEMPDKLQLALEAIHVERNLIKENVGSQDQVTAAFGGFNLITFSAGDRIGIQPVTLSAERMRLLHGHLILLFTGFSRQASEIAAEQIKNTPRKTSELQAMRQLVDEALAILNSKRDIAEFGRLLHEGWQLKRSLSSQISNPTIDDIYAQARSAGAVGGKLLGAGGGGFMLFFAPPERHPAILKKLSAFLHVPFEFDSQGSHIIFFEPNQMLP